jgi:hypothetical protein
LHARLADVVSRRLKLKSSGASAAKVPFGLFLSLRVAATGEFLCASIGPMGRKDEETGEARELRPPRAVDWLKRDSTGARRCPRIRSCRLGYLGSEFALILHVPPVTAIAVKTVYQTPD